MAILKQKKDSNTKQLNIRIDSNLADEIESIKNDAESAGFVFDVSAIVSRSLKLSAKKARLELGKAINKK